MLLTKELLQIDQFALLDVKEGLETTGTEELLKQMIQLMVDTLPDDLALMEKAYSSHDWDKAQHFAHKIKAGAVYLGTHRLKMACQYFERYFKSG